MDKYCIRNKNCGLFVVDDEDYTFYKKTMKEASKFTEKQAEKRLSKMKHPENWKIIKCEVEE